MATYSDKADWFVIRAHGKTDAQRPDPPIVGRAGGIAEALGKAHFGSGRGCHSIVTIEIAPGNREVLHRHWHIESVWVVLEGQGEFYPDEDTAVPFKAPAILHSFQQEWHGIANTGTEPLRYISIEGPMTGRRDQHEFAE